VISTAILSRKRTYYLLIVVLRIDYLTDYCSIQPKKQIKLVLFFDFLPPQDIVTQ